jgi:hypothetical protein
VSGIANWNSFVTVHPVIPGSWIRASCYATTNSLPACTNDSGYVDAYIDVKITPLVFNGAFGDTAETAGSWITGTPVGADSGFVRKTEHLDWGDTRGAAEIFGAISDSSLASSYVRTRGIFHCGDEWGILRGGDLQGLTSPWYSTPTNAQGGRDYNLRWRPFFAETAAPENCYWIKVEWDPVGWSTAESDSLQLAGIEVQLTPR